MILTPSCSCLPVMIRQLRWTVAHKANRCLQGCSLNLLPIVCVCVLVGMLGRERFLLALDSSPRHSSQQIPWSIVIWGPLSFVSWEFWLQTSANKSLGNRCWDNLDQTQQIKMCNMHPIKYSVHQHFSYCLSEKEYLGKGRVFLFPSEILFIFHWFKGRSDHPDPPVQWFSPS